MVEPNAFINGDCMDYLPEYPDNYFDLAIVDPVYGDVPKGGYMYRTEKYQGHGQKALTRVYHQELWRQEKTNKAYFDELRRVSRNQIIWGGNYFANNLPTSQGWIVWDKEHPKGVKFADFELAWTSFNQASRMFRYMWNGMLQGDMKNKEDRIHPTQKPVQLYKWLLSNYAKSGDVILDTHAGSASSLVACREMGFKYVGYEIDRQYFEKASERLQTATDQMNIFDFSQYMNPPGEE